jgi:hypothetical protein
MQDEGSIWAAILGSIGYFLLVGCYYIFVVFGVTIALALVDQAFGLNMLPAFREFNKKLFRQSRNWTPSANAATGPVEVTITQPAAQAQTESVASAPNTVPINPEAKPEIKATINQTVRKRVAQVIYPNESLTHTA